MIGRDGVRRPTRSNPARINAEAVPVNTLEVLLGCSVPTGYASRAGDFRPLGGFDCRRDQSRHDALTAILAAHIKARDRPDRCFINAIENSPAVEPGQFTPRRGVGRVSRFCGTRFGSARAPAYDNHCRSSNTCTSSRCLRRPCRTSLQRPATDQA